MTKRKVVISDSGMRGLTREVQGLGIESFRLSSDGNTIIIQLEDDLEVEISKDTLWDISLTY